MIGSIASRTFFLEKLTLKVMNGFFSPVGVKLIAVAGEVEFTENNGEVVLR